MAELRKGLRALNRRLQIVNRAAGPAPGPVSVDTPSQPRPHPSGGLRIARRLAQWVSTIFAMAGWRLEHLTPVWCGGGFASLLLAHVLIAHADPRRTVPYFLATLVFYYGGNAMILLSSAPARTIARLGEARAFRRYEALAGLMFLNQGLGVGAMSALHLTRWEQLAPSWVWLALGVGLFAGGLVVKLWATLTAGVDIYFFRDMFVRRALVTGELGGPYRFLRNPMYSVGQLQGYGYALLCGSAPGLIAAAIGHVLIYVFYLGVERPFVRRTYPPRSRPHAGPASPR
jgi:protein-S-isoprenylcysteine O-methyltransferase Ste14